MGIMKINGISLNVDIQGQGEPLILIHALGTDHRQWSSEIVRLSRKFKTVALDCRGHGLSDKPESYTLNDHVEDVLALMDALDFQTALLSGISMGSYIAQGVAVRQPERIKKLILTVPKSNGLTSSTQRLIKEHRQEFLRLNEQERNLFFIGHMAYNQEALLAHPELFDSNLTPEQTLAANRALEGFDFRNELPEITAETLVISGRHDGLNPPEEGRLCARLIPNSTFAELPYSGHIPLVEEPEAYAAAVDKFLGI